MFSILMHSAVQLTRGAASNRCQSIMITSACTFRLFYVNKLRAVSALRKHYEIQPDRAWVKPVSCCFHQKNILTQFINLRSGRQKRKIEKVSETLKQN